MSLRVKWLPICHVPHGYRRVFVVYENDQIKNVIALAHLGYEDVYNVQQKASTPQNIKDPALLWGLSLVKSLLGSAALEESEDGYFSVRPKVPEAEELISDDEYLKAVENGEYLI
jgi:hypothetical protein